MPAPRAPRAAASSGSAHGVRLHRRREEAAEREVVGAGVRALLRARQVVVAGGADQARRGQDAHARPRSSASSRPRCTPSAPHSRASSTSSLTMSSTPCGRHSAASARACLTLQMPVGALVAILQHRAPPASDLLHARDSQSLSTVSGVIGVQPAHRGASISHTNRVNCRGAPIPHLRLFLPRPEQAIGDVLAHAGPISRVQRLPGVLLSVAHRLGDVQPVGDRGGDGGGERAARAVVAARQALPGVVAHHAVLR